MDSRGERRRNIAAAMEKTTAIWKSLQWRDGHAAMGNDDGRIASRGELLREENCYQGDLWRMKMVKPFSYWSLEILKRWYLKFINYYVIGSGRPLLISFEDIMVLIVDNTYSREWVKGKARVSWPTVFTYRFVQFPYKWETPLVVYIVWSALASW